MLPQGTVLAHTDAFSSKADGGGLSAPLPGWRRGPSQPGCHCGPRPCCLLVGSASVSAPCVSPLLPTWSRELLWPHSGFCSARCPPDLGAPCPGLSPFLAAALTRSLVPGFPPGPGPCLYSPVSPLKGRHMPRTPSPFPSLNNRLLKSHLLPEESIFQKGHTSPPPPPSA